MYSFFDFNCIVLENGKILVHSFLCLFCQATLIKKEKVLHPSSTVSLTREQKDKRKSQRGMDASDAGIQATILQTKMQEMLEGKREK